MDNPAVEVEGLCYAYGDREALAGVTFTVSRGEIFGFLGPNGGGKTTLFKVLSTLRPPTVGRVRVFGHDLARAPDAVRMRLGVVFQDPSLDLKLTVMENLLHHGHLYGLWGQALQSRAREVLEGLGLGDRARDLVETLSGGLRRRTELAKVLVHRPELLIMDEPSTGLDPGARQEFSAYLRRLRQQDGVTILLTTHLIEEAEQCDRVGFLHEGRVVAIGEPDALKGTVGGDVIVIDAHNPKELQGKMRDRFGCDAVLVDGSLRVERPCGHEFVREVVEAFPGAVKSAAFGRPTLEDVFIRLAGRRLWSNEA
ncbi:MAG: ABC transporter ATP-binding protein [candidate division NC10 bacterium]|nr:ABC transporter ATP-binding protein [candidate division NC10 bacterium]